jgi:transposase
MAQGALTAATAGGEVVPASDYRRELEAQVRELQRLFGKKTMENELLREGSLSGRRPNKTAVALDLVAGGWTVSAVVGAIGIARPHLLGYRD